MNELTTMEIMNRHDELSAKISNAPVIIVDGHDLLDAHKDRGNLLDKLDNLTKVAEDLADKLKAAKQEIKNGIAKIAAYCVAEKWAYDSCDEEYKQTIAELRTMRDRAFDQFQVVSDKLKKLPERDND